MMLTLIINFTSIPNDRSFQKKTALAVAMFVCSSLSSWHRTSDTSIRFIFTLIWGGKKSGLLYASLGRSLILRSYICEVHVQFLGLNHFNLSNSLLISIDWSAILCMRKNSKLFIWDSVCCCCVLNRSQIHMFVILSVNTKLLFNHLELEHW